MEIFAGHRALFRPLASPTVALGNFDGVHVGHQKLLIQTSQKARANDGDAVVLTFDPHPAALLAADRAPALIMTVERRLELLESFGITVCVVEPFTQALAALTPEQFVQDVLVSTLGAQNLIVGHDFTFGKDRKGTSDTLRSLGLAKGISVSVVAPVEVGGVRVSSTQIRELVLKGEIAKVKPLLGRHFDIDGAVVKGAGRGRSLGIPTANLATKTPLLPALGVYAAIVHNLSSPWDTDGNPAVVNLGKNPTFVDDGIPQLEVHLLDFDGNLYDQHLRIELVARLRPEQRFATPEQLVTQIRSDIDHTRRILSAVQ